MAQLKGDELAKARFEGPIWEVQYYSAGQPPSGAYYSTWKEAKQVYLDSFPRLVMWDHFSFVIRRVPKQTEGQPWRYGRAVLSGKVCKEPILDYEVIGDGKGGMRIVAVRASDRFQIATARQIHVG